MKPARASPIQNPKQSQWRANPNRAARPIRLIMPSMMATARFSFALPEPLMREKANSYPNTLSGGQQQRAAIARALAMEPDVLCFDEPTSALDPLLTKEVLNVIRLLRTEGRTMIVVTHEMAFAREASDQVAFLSGGTVAELGTPQEIFEAPRTEALQRFLRQ